MIASADGCRAGWVVALAERWPSPTPPHLAVCRDFAAVLTVTAGCAVVMVDIPIGFPADGQQRECDKRAKEQLGKQGASIFHTPPRSLLDAKSHAEFSARHCELFAGNGATQQSFGLVPKLREVDRAMTPALQTRVREFHPELVWQRLADGPLPPKKEHDGRAARWNLLSPWIATRTELTAWRKRSGSALRACLKTP